MLEINDQTRLLLRSTGAIQINDEGDEVFTGLTVCESSFLLKCSQTEPFERDPADEFLLNQLRHRHLKARLGELYIPTIKR